MSLRFAKQGQQNAPRAQTFQNIIPRAPKRLTQRDNNETSQALSLLKIFLRFVLTHILSLHIIIVG
jgi:hypothetical protein